MRRVTVTLRIPPDLHSLLEERRRRTGVPTNVFVTRLVAAGLAREAADGRDAKPRRRSVG